MTPLVQCRIRIEERKKKNFNIIFKSRNETESFQETVVKTVKQVEILFDNLKGHFQRTFFYRYLGLRLMKQRKNKIVILKTNIEGVWILQNG